MAAVSLNQDVVFENAQDCDRHFQLSVEDTKTFSFAKRIFTLMELTSDGIDPIETTLSAARGNLFIKSSDGTSLQWSIAFSSEFKAYDAAGNVSAKFKLVDERSIEMTSSEGEAVGRLHMGEDFKEATFTGSKGVEHVRFSFDEDASQWSLSWDGEGSLDPSLIDSLAIITDLMALARPSPESQATTSNILWIGTGLILIASMASICF